MSFRIDIGLGVERNACAQQAGTGIYHDFVVRMPSFDPLPPDSTTTVRAAVSAVDNSHLRELTTTKLMLPPG